MTVQATMVRLGPDDAGWVTQLLTASFLDEAPATHLFQGPRREAQTAYFMRCTCRYALLFGEGYSTPDRQGVALWLLPGQTAMTPGRMYKAGMLMAPVHMGLSGFRRFMAFAGHTEKLHKRAAPMPHYYLFTLGVSPDAQGKGVGRGLVEEMLQRIDGEKFPAFLETQKSRNVDLYRRLGFDVSAESAFPSLEGLCNWAMLREATGRTRRQAA